MAVDFKWDYDAAGELLRMPGTVAILEQAAQQRCPTGCKVDTMIGSVRANARITTDTAEAYRDNLKNNTLAKAIGS